MLPSASSNRSKGDIYIKREEEEREISKIEMRKEIILRKDRNKVKLIPFAFLYQFVLRERCVQALVLRTSEGQVVVPRPPMPLEHGQ